MGCDGGTINDRRDIIVKVKSKKKEIDEQTLFHLMWTTCKISKQPLEEPIVTCRMGYLYNKEAILQALLNKTLDKKIFFHIKGIKDLIEVKFTKNPAYDNNNDNPRWICPVTQQEIGGKYKFFVSKKCGHVFSERAIREIGSEGFCTVCNTPYKNDDLHLLNPPKKIEKSLRKKLKEEIKSKKKSNGITKSSKTKSKNHVEEKRETKLKILDKEIDLSTFAARDKPPPGADEKVWKSIFVDKSKKEEENPNNFLTRPGMKSLI